MLLLALSGQQEVLWVNFSSIRLRRKVHQKGSLQWYKESALEERVAEESVLKFSQWQRHDHLLFTLF